MLKFCFCIILSLCGCTSYVSEQNLFNPSRATIRTSDSIGIGLTRKVNLELEVAPNIVLRGYKIFQPNAKLSLLYFGGNGSKLVQSRTFLDSLCIRLNMVLYSFDWRGYGFSDGNPSLREIMDDALKIFDFVRDSSKSVPVVVGRSLGSGVASYVAAERVPAGIVLISTLSNLNTVIESWSRFLPWYQRPFVSICPDSELQNLHPQPYELAHRITCPVLILHGDNDALIPLSSALELFDSLSQSKFKKFVTLKGKNHYNIDLISGPEADTIANFLKYLKQ